MIKPDRLNSRSSSAAPVGAEGIAGDVELFRPVGNVGRHFGVDLFGIAGALDGAVLVEGAGSWALAASWCSDMRGFLFPGVPS